MPMPMREHVRLLALIQIAWSSIGLLIGVLVLLTLGGFGMFAARQAALPTRTLRRRRRLSAGDRGRGRGDDH